MEALTFRYHKLLHILLKSLGLAGLMATRGSGVGGGVLSRYAGRLASNLRGTLDYWELSERSAVLI